MSIFLCLENKVAYICKTIFDSNRVLSSAYKRPMTRKNGHKWHEYVYDEYYDSVICLNTKYLSTEPPTEMVTESTKVNLISVNIA